MIWESLNLSKFSISSLLVQYPNVKGPSEVRELPILNNPIFSHPWKARMFMPGGNVRLWNRCARGFMSKLLEYSVYGVNHKGQGMSVGAKTVGLNWGGATKEIVYCVGGYRLSFHSDPIQLRAMEIWNNCVAL